MRDQGGSGGMPLQHSICSNLASNIGGVSTARSPVAWQMFSGVTLHMHAGLQLHQLAPDIARMGIKGMLSRSRIQDTDRRFEDKPAVQRLWAAISAQLQTCSDCVNAYHAAQVTKKRCNDWVPQHQNKAYWMLHTHCYNDSRAQLKCVLQLYIREEFSEESSAPLLAVMQRRDVERLSARLTRTAGDILSSNSAA
jgi:hypothetical protein